MNHLAHRTRRNLGYGPLLLLFLLALLLLPSWRPAVAADLDVTEPMGGEVYVSRGNMAIEWDLTLEADEYVTYASIYYVWGGESERHLIAHVHEDLLNGSYTWTNVPVVTEMSYLRIEVDAIALDIGRIARDRSVHVKVIPNTATPSIYLTSPQPSCDAWREDCATPLVLESGEFHFMHIRWAVTGCRPPYESVPMTIEFAANGITWEEVAVIPSPCSWPFYRWQIPNIETDRARIRLRWGELDWSSNIHAFAISEAPPPPNHTPTADAGPDTNVPEGERVNLDGTGSSDPDAGDFLTYRWTQSDGSSFSVDLHGANTSSPWFIAPDATDFDIRLEFSLTVTDRHGARDSDDVRITVTPGSPSVTSFSPSEGWEKTLIRIRGRNLSGCEVYLHGVLIGTVPNSGHDTDVTIALPGGLPLGPSRLRVTNDAGSHTTSGRFTVERTPYSWDWGFGFHNPTVDDMSWADYDRAFGREVWFWGPFGFPVMCERDRQCHDPIAQRMYESVYRDLGQNGLCWGMCSQSVTFYYGDTPPLFMSPLRDWPFNLSPETELARRVKRDHMRQISSQVINYLLGHYDDRPVDVLAQIQAATELDPPRPGIIGLVNLIGGGFTSLAGHALVPDRVVQISANEWRIYVYDPNREEFSLCRDVTDPAEYERITDLEEYPFIRVWRGGGVESWSFEMAGGGLWQGNTATSIDISVGGSTLIEIPYFGFSHYPEDVVRGSHNMPLSPEGLFTIIFGAADVGIEDTRRRRVGHDSRGRYYMQIPEALPVANMDGEPTGNDAYVLPLGSYRNTIYGRETGAYEWMALHDNASAGVSDVEIRRGAEDRVETADDNRELTFQTQDTQKSYSAQLTRKFFNRRNPYWRYYEIIGTSIAPGDAGRFRTEDGGNSLVYENHGRHAVQFSARFSLTALGPQPEPPDNVEPRSLEDVTLEQQGIRLPADHVAILTPTSWTELGDARVRVTIVPVGGTQNQFIRGDANVDRNVDISDAVATLGHLFLGQPPQLPCEKAADTDDNGAVDITDAIYLLGFQFLGGPQPPAPFPGCGFDGTPDALECAQFPPCNNDAQ